MLRQITKYYLKTLSAVLILAPLLSFSVHAQTVPYVSNRYLQLSSSATSAINTSYTLGFDMPSPAIIGSIKLEFCNESPLPNTPCTVPDGFSTSSIVLSQQSGETGFSISGLSSNGKIIINRAPTLSTATSLKYVFTNITNPDEIRTYYARIYIYSAINEGGTVAYEGGIAFVINNVVPINSIVPPYLKFCIGQSIPQYNCASAAGQLLDFGELSSTRTKYAQHQMLVATNAAYGYGITVSGVTMTSGNNSIPTNNVATSSAVGTGQFGFNLKANSSPGIGAEPVGPTPGNTISPQYGISNKFAFKNGDVIAMSNTTTDYYRYTASYIVNVDKQQKPGIYSTTVVYICLANF